MRVSSGLWNEGDSQWSAKIRSLAGVLAALGSTPMPELLQPATERRSTANCGEGELSGVRVGCLGGVGEKDTT